jgi:hypothetical protein
METEPQDGPSMPYEEMQRQERYKEQLELISKWVAIFSEHHHREISELGMATYIEGLKDLSANQIAYGCEMALKEVDRMPTVAHIRERVNRYDETALYQKAHVTDCAHCQGTGWKDRGDGKYIRCVH